MKFFSAIFFIISFNAFADAIKNEICDNANKCEDAKKNCDAVKEEKDKESNPDCKKMKTEYKKGCEELRKQCDSYKPNPDDDGGDKGKKGGGGGGQPQQQQQQQGGGGGPPSGSPPQSSDSPKNDTPSTQPADTQPPPQSNTLPCRTDTALTPGGPHGCAEDIVAKCVSAGTNCAADGFGDRMTEHCKDRPSDPACKTFATVVSCASNSNQPQCQGNAHAVDGGKSPAGQSPSFGSGGGGLPATGANPIQPASVMEKGGERAAAHESPDGGYGGDGGGSGGGRDGYGRDDSRPSASEKSPGPASSSRAAGLREIGRSGADSVIKIVSEVYRMRCQLGKFHHCGGNR